MRKKNWVPCKKNFKNILIFGHSNIGDVCYNLGIVPYLKKNFPGSKINFITSPVAQPVVSLMRGIDEVIVFDKHNKDKGFFGYGKFVRMINWKNFDLAIILRGQMYHFFNIPMIIHAGKNRSNHPNAHILEQHIKLLEQIGIKPDQIKLEFNFSSCEIQFAKNKCKPYSKKNKIGIMPFAAWKLKCWPVENWNKLIKKLKEKYLAEIFVFGKTNKDDPWETMFLEKLDQNIVSFVNECDLRKSLALINEMDLFISCDTSLLHFASCMGIKSVGLFGPTNNKQFYPFAHKNLMVLTSLNSGCVPCFDQKEVGSCGVKGEPAECMINITIEAVMDKADQAIKTGSS